MIKNNLKNFIITKNATLIESVQAIQYNQARTVIVVNNLNDKKILGVLSQGDILKAILQSIDLHSNIDAIINRSFKYLEEDNEVSANKIFSQKGYGLIPVVDNKMVLLGVFTMVENLRNITRAV